MDERGAYLTALFGCRVYPPGEEWRDLRADGLEWPEALAWCRERADRVTVRLDSDFYSAGRIPGPEPPVDETLRFERRRFPGWEFLDLTEADPPISWDVEVGVDPVSAREFATPAGLTAIGQGWCAALRSSRSCDVIWAASSLAADQVPQGLGPWALPAPRLAVIRFEQHGYANARDRASREAAAAAKAAGWALTGRLSEFSVDGIYATGSAAARQNLRLGEDG
jgi:hypothetical protein